MRSTPAWGRTPRQSVAEEVARRGSAAVVAGCVALLEGRPVDGPLVLALGGPAARWALTGDAGGPDQWLRVWGARRLLYAWDPSATAAVTRAVTAALADGSWRVREAAARVVARHELDEALDALARLQHDPVPRVRAAAVRALARLSGAAAGAAGRNTPG